MWIATATILDMPGPSRSRHAAEAWLFDAFRMFGPRFEPAGTSENWWNLIKSAALMKMIMMQSSLFMLLFLLNSCNRAVKWRQWRRALLAADAMLAWRIYCKQNETPYALIIPTQQRFTAHLLYKTRLSKNLWRQAAISTKCFGLPVWVSYSCERVAWFCFHLRACVPGRCLSPSTLS